MTQEFQKRFYLTFRVLALVLLVMLFLFGRSDSVGKRELQMGFFVVMMFPVIVPFLYSLIFRGKQNHAQLYLYLASLGIFLVIASVIDVQLAHLFLRMLFTGAFISFLFVKSSTPKASTQVTEPIPSPVSQPIQPDDHPLIPAPPKIDPTIAGKIERKIAEVQKKVDQYQGQLDRLNAEREKREAYLNGLNERLASDYLSQENKEVSITLKATLESTLENYYLLIKFFSEAQDLFIREKKNLADTLNNLEIIAFLKQESPLQHVAEVEKTMLQMEFEQHIKELEEDMPILTDKMLADSIDLSDEMKRQLEEAMLKLR